MRRAIAAITAATFLAGCALTVDPQSGQFSQIKPGMDRSQVVQLLGDPPQTLMANGLSSLESWACEPDGQIVTIQTSYGWLAVEYILTLGIGGLVEAARYYKLQQRINKCDVYYDDAGKVSRTMSMHGPVVTR